MKPIPRSDPDKVEDDVVSPLEVHPADAGLLLLLFHSFSYPLHTLTVINPTLMALKAPYPAPDGGTSVVSKYLDPHNTVDNHFGGP